MALEQVAEIAVLAFFLLALPGGMVLMTWRGILWAERQKRRPQDVPRGPGLWDDDLDVPRSVRRPASSSSPSAEDERALIVLGGVMVLVFVVTFLLIQASR